MTDYAYAIAYSRQDATRLGHDGWRAIPGSFNYDGHTNERTGDWIEDIAILMERTIDPGPAELTEAADPLDKIAEELRSLKKPWDGVPGDDGIIYRLVDIVRATGREI